MAGPSYLSRFGGLWTDLTNARDVIGGKLELGWITRQQAEQLEKFVADGYLILPGAVPSEVVDRVVADLEAAWDGRFADAFPHVYTESWENGSILVKPPAPELRGRQARLYNIHSVSEAARDAFFSPAIRSFLHLLFERPALAFQTLSFLRGSEQLMHQDPTYVVVRSPLEMAASWIALEDMEPGCGELEFFEGSHRIEEHVWTGGQRHMPAGDPGHQRYIESLYEKCQRLGLRRSKFHAKKGDALIWAADLVHGGSPIEGEGKTRRSLVTHYCPAELDSGCYPSSGKRPHGQGCYYVPAARAPEAAWTQPS